MPAAPAGCAFRVPHVTRSGRLATALVANLALVGGLAGAGLAAHSLAVWAEAVDYLADAAGVAVSLFAVYFANLVPTPRRPHGYPNATRYAALVNAGWLFVLNLVVAGAAVDRLAGNSAHVHGLPVLVASSVAAVVMVATAFVLGGEAEGEGGDGDDEGGTLNVRAVLLDTAADGAAAAGVAAAGGVIYATGGLFWIDPAVALAISVVVGYHAAQLLARIRRSFKLAPQARQGTGGARENPPQAAGA